MTETAQPFDSSILKDWYANSPSKAEKFIELTLKDCDRLFSEINLAMTNCDTAELGEGAHALKSVAAQIGGNELMALCRELEIAGKENRFEDAKQKFEKLQPAYQDFLETIRLLMKNHEAV